MSRRVLSLLSAVVTVAALATVVAAPASAKVTKGTRESASLNAGVLTQLNRIRLAHHLAPLAPSPALGRAAAQHSRDMLARGYFAHNSGNGTPFWKRIRTYYSDGGFGYWSVGENLYWASGSTDAAASIKAWMASPEHRANILDPAWRQIGIAAVSSPDAPGTFAGLGVTVITTDFGVRR